VHGAGGPAPYFAELARRSTIARITTTVRKSAAYWRADYAARLGPARHMQGAGVGALNLAARLARCLARPIRR